ncbi:MAG: hypothetical protein DID89_2727547549 [Candidatus Nitrotoga sp. CP45]|nr:MAG: hypothetical protein DID89_2727547549 [Candidatus Nitrotoga sp. CP45]
MTEIYRRNAIVVGNWFNDGWRANARLSIAAIARRWGGLAVIELTQPIGNDDCGFAQKLWLDKHCEEFDRVIWFDRDIIVRYDCPNLFEIVTKGNFGCVSAHQIPWHIREDAKSLMPLFTANGVPYDYTVDHLNTGIMVFEPQQHTDIFSEARNIFGAAEQFQFYDEPPISLAVKKSGQRQLLDKSFNRCGIANLDDFMPKMTDYIWHFCGIKSDYVNSQIDATLWQLSPLPVWTKPIIGSRPAKKIIGFWHIGAIGDCFRIISEQYRKLKESGLYDASEKIVVGFVGGKNREQELNIPILEDPKFEVFVTEDPRDYEFPTLARVWKEAQENEESFLCYYLHTKGASSVATPREDATNAWREYMEYFNIEKWEDCATVLKEYETCGVELQCEQSHYSGNFWWATSEYIKKLPNGYEFWRNHKDERIWAEFYLCLAHPKAYCFNDFLENLYDFQISPKLYRK